jgi:hypothetical protein
MFLILKAPDVTRTHDFFITSEALYQLSYRSIFLNVRSHCTRYNYISWSLKFKPFRPRKQQRLGFRLA